MTPQELIEKSAGEGVSETLRGVPGAVIIGDDEHGFIGAVHAPAEADYDFDWYSDSVFPMFAEAEADLQRYLAERAK